MVAKPQWWGLNDNGGGSTMTAAAQQRWWRLHDNSGGQPTIDGLSTTMAAAPQQRWHLYDDGGGSRLRQLHTDWMVVCLKLDGCCLYCALSAQLNCP